MSCNCPKCSYTNDDTNTLAELQVAVEEIQQKLALNNNNSSSNSNNNSNSNKPLSPTGFKCIGTNGKIVTLNSKEVPAGTLIDYGSKREAFRALVVDIDNKPWVLYTNKKLSHEQFAEMMRGLTNHPVILYWGL